MIFSFFFFSSRRRHTRFDCDWSSDVCSSDLVIVRGGPAGSGHVTRQPRRGSCSVARGMDPVRSSAARPRASDAIPLPRPLPVGSAILWTPTVDGAPDASPYAIFITQSALAAVHAHVEAKPRGAASLGFLAGNRFECPESGTAYVVIESAIQLPWSIAGDHLRPALSQGWTVVQEDVRTHNGQLLG